MCLERVGALHALERLLHALAQRDFVAQLQVVVVEDVVVDVHGARRDRPRQPADDLVEGRERGQSRAEVPAGQQQLGDLAPEPGVREGGHVHRRGQGVVLHKDRNDGLHRDRAVLAPDRRRLGDGR